MQTICHLEKNFAFAIVSGMAVILQIMEKREVLAYFDSDGVVEHYANAAARIGLWESEENIFTRVFKPKDSILELGCGAGRIAFGMFELGYTHLMASDYSKNMVERARHLAKILEYRIPMQVADATQLKFENAVFDGAIFGFNGLMQIPDGAQREAALGEMYRVLRPGGYCVFTSHDRDRSAHQDFWESERARWARGQQWAELDRFGDRAEATAHGTHFMHVPTMAEMESVIHAVGFRVEATCMRSEIAHESKAVEDFSDDCRFWVVQKPEAGGGGRTSNVERPTPNF
jgi:ubiquinone/menaquinone biosynthesis C-methylase UbiE